MNTTLELVSQFVASDVFRVGSLSNENIASGFPETLGSRDELDIKLSRLE